MFSANGPGSTFSLEYHCGIVVGLRDLLLETAGLLFPHTCAGYLPCGFTHILPCESVVSESGFLNALNTLNLLGIFTFELTYKVGFLVAITFAWQVSVLGPSWAFSYEAIVSTICKAAT